MSYRDAGSSAGFGVSRRVCRVAVWSMAGAGAVLGSSAVTAGSASAEGVATLGDSLSTYLVPTTELVPPTGFESADASVSQVPVPPISAPPASVSTAPGGGLDAGAPPSDVSLASTNGVSLASMNYGSDDPPSPSSAVDLSAVDEERGQREENHYGEKQPKTGEPEPNVASAAFETAQGVAPVLPPASKPGVAPSGGSAPSGGEVAQAGARKPDIPSYWRVIPGTNGQRFELVYGNPPRPHLTHVYQSEYSPSSAQSTSRSPQSSSGSSQALGNVKSEHPHVNGLGSESTQAEDESTQLPPGDPWPVTTNDRGASLAALVNQVNPDNEFLYAHIPVGGVEASGSARQLIKPASGSSVESSRKSPRAKTYYVGDNVLVVAEPAPVLPKYQSKKFISGGNTFNGPSLDELLESDYFLKGTESSGWEINTRPEGSRYGGQSDTEPKFAQVDTKIPFGTPGDFSNGKQYENRIRLYQELLKNNPDSWEPFRAEGRKTF